MQSVLQYSAAFSYGCATGNDFINLKIISFPVSLGQILTDGREKSKLYVKHKILKEQKSVSKIVLHLNTQFIEKTEAALVSAARLS